MPCFCTKACGVYIPPRCVGRIPCCQHCCGGLRWQCAACQQHFKALREATVLLGTAVRIRFSWAGMVWLFKATDNPSGYNPMQPSYSKIPHVTFVYLTRKTGKLPAPDVFHLPKRFVGFSPARVIEAAVRISTLVAQLFQQHDVVPRAATRLSPNDDRACQF